VQSSSRPKLFGSIRREPAERSEAIQRRHCSIAAVASSRSSPFSYETMV
jgi:hypothetical protein